jgi:hypothetical protein
VLGRHITIPGTQQEGDTKPVHPNGDKQTKDDGFVDSLFDSGALNLLVVRGLRLDLSSIVLRNSLNHCTPLGTLDRYALAHVLVFLGTGMSTKNKILRTEMLENGINLAVRRHHVLNGGCTKGRG